MEVRESLGSDVFVYVTAEGGSATTTELEELAKDSGLRDSGAETPHVVARLDAATLPTRANP